MTATAVDLTTAFAGLSETGPVRAGNEDCIGWGRMGTMDLGEIGARLMGRCDPADGVGLVFAVGDGLGAYGGGDVASRIAVETMIDAAAEARPGSKIPALLRGAFSDANRLVFDAALEGRGARKMQTTMSALVLSRGEAFIGHVGDCRVYRLRGENVELLTTDHTQVTEMLRMRLITPEQAADHPGRYALTRSLGGELIVRTDVRSESLNDRDAFLLCSDGLWGKVSVGEIRDALGGDLEAGCAALVERAIERGGEDNSTAMALRVEAAGQAPERRAGWRRLFA